MTALLGCTGCSDSFQRLGSPPATATVVAAPARPTTGSGPFLYVGGLNVAMYALGSSTPLHVTSQSPTTVFRAAMALDLHGHLCYANGEISYGWLVEYDARTLELVREVGGSGDLRAMAANRFGYLYASTDGAYIEIYAPGCLRQVHRIGRGAGNAGDLIFDRSGNLYKGNGAPKDVVSVYAPTSRPGHMKLVRRIRDGISAPGTLALGPSGDLFVGNYSYSSKKSYVTVYRSGQSKPALTITKGINVATSLAVDSKGRLYVATADYGAPRGWVSVYPPGGSEPVRKVRFVNPIALAIDASDRLYVIDSTAHSSVLVYNAGATKLLFKITRGFRSPTALLIGSP